MAFIDFKNDALLALPAPAPATNHARRLVPAMITTQPLTKLERRVIELARQDGLTSLQPRRERSWLASVVFGPTPPSPVLANERLEALRRLAVRVWHEGYLVPVSAMKEAIAAGFSEAQVGAVLDMIARLREPLRAGPMRRQ